MTSLNRPDLEMGCVEPGLWWVEGVQVRRVRRGVWLVVWEPSTGLGQEGRSEKFETFNDALWKIADAIEMGEFQSHKGEHHD